MLLDFKTYTNKYKRHKKIRHLICGEQFGLILSYTCFHQGNLFFPKKFKKI